MKNNDQESFEFKNLESIRYYQQETELTPITIESIMKNNEFYKLKSIETYVVNADIYVKLNVINLQGIENLRIWNGEWLLLDTNNLKLLELKFVDLKVYENWSQLMNVEKLGMDFCAIKGDNLNSFFKVHKFEKLKKFTFYHGFNNSNVDNSLENVRVSWNYLHYIRIYSSDLITDNFFINNEFKNLETIKLYSLRLITGNKWKLSSTIRSFYIVRCHNFEPSYFKRNEMKNVEKITVIDCQKVNREIDIFKNKIEQFSYKEDYTNLNNLIKTKMKYNVFYKKSAEELCNLKHLVLDDETFYE